MLVWGLKVRGWVVALQACFFLSPAVTDDSEEWACADETASFCNESVRLRVYIQTGRFVTRS